MENNPALGEQLKRDAIEQVNEHANEMWKKAAYRCVEFLAHHRDDFTTDDVWEMMDRLFPKLSTHEHRAMGAVIVRARSAGLIEPADKRPRPSVRPEAHRNPKTVWEGTP